MPLVDLGDDLDPSALSKRGSLAYRRTGILFAMNSSQALEMVPTEIWALIFSFLASQAHQDKGSHADLQSITLTCKLFCRLAQPLLFYELVLIANLLRLENAIVDDNGADIRRISANVYQRLSYYQSPHIIGHVHVVRISFGHHIFPASPQPGLLGAIASASVQLLPCFPCLEELELCNVSLKAQDLQVLSAIPGPIPKVTLIGCSLHSECRNFTIPAKYLTLRVDTEPFLAYFLASPFHSLRHLSCSFSDLPALCSHLVEHSEETGRLLSLDLTPDTDLAPDNLLDPSPFVKIFSHCDSLVELTMRGGAYISWSSSPSLPPGHLPSLTDITIDASALSYFSRLPQLRNLTISSNAPRVDQEPALFVTQLHSNRNLFKKLERMSLNIIATEWSLNDQALPRTINEVCTNLRMLNLQTAYQDFVTAIRLKQLLSASPPLSLSAIQLRCWLPHPLAHSKSEWIAWARNTILPDIITALMLPKIPKNGGSRLTCIRLLVT